MPPRKKQPSGPTPSRRSGTRTSASTSPPPTPVSSCLPTWTADAAQVPPQPDLDPQLVWRGKDEQDGEDLVVDAPPIYIQEKIVPQVIIENLAQGRREAASCRCSRTSTGSTGYEAVEFYQHEANWSNRMILGDSLQVMASLAEKENLRGKVQMIYIDPPYGIKFGSNWQVSHRQARCQGRQAEDVTREVEQIKAFRDTWELGIHSYLSYLRDRLIVARDLLTESDQFSSRSATRTFTSSAAFWMKFSAARTSFTRSLSEDQRRQTSADMLGGVQLTTCCGTRRIWSA